MTAESQTYRRRSGIYRERKPNARECQQIESELRSITSAEIAGAYSALCGQLLAQAIVAVRRRSIRRKEEIGERKRARKWVEEKDTGVITFVDCCMALGIDAERTARQIKRYAADPASSPINRAVIGVLQNAD